jgi:hypothetical protein
MSEPDPNRSQTALDFCGAHCRTTRQFRFAHFPVLIKRVSQIWHDPNYGAEMRPLRSGAIVSDRGAEDAYAIASAFARASAAGGVLATRSSNLDRKACIHRW